LSAFDSALPSHNASTPTADAREFQQTARHSQRESSYPIIACPDGIAFIAPMMLPVRYTAVTMAVLLCACSFDPLPKVRVGNGRTAAGDRANARDEKLSKSLADAQAAAGDLATSRSAYNSAVETFVMELQRRMSPHGWATPVRVKAASGAWEVSFDRQPFARQGQPEWSPGLFDSITPSHDFDVKGYLTRVGGSGTGVPVVLTMKNTSLLRKERSFRPNNWLFAPGTVVLDFGKPTAGATAKPVRMRILNTLDYRKAKVAGSERALAYDITSMVQASLNNGYILNNGLAGLLRPDRRSHDLGLFGLDVYDPKKIPVVFVHGLDSSPSIWSNCVNQIYADPTLDARYQPLLFIYPSGMSVPVAAARFRDSMVKYRAKWDPDNNDPNFNRMVIVGHSMGGLLTRLQVVDSGEELRKAFFTRPIQENRWLTAKEKQTMETALVIKPAPFVSRAVFVAVPHRGSEIADFRIVQFALRLIKLPFTASDIVRRAMIAGPTQLNPAVLRYNSLGLRSVEMLSPEHPYIKALDKRPITVPFHSIIGDRGKGFGSNSSDGVVPYWSSHLDRAHSEKIVPYGHSCTAKRETVDEILRILKMHASAK
jgi:pimeloyl-ACP methyl ester carboxylesterase